MTTSATLQPCKVSTRKRRTAGWGLGFGLASTLAALILAGLTVPFDTPAAHADDLDDDTQSFALSTVSRQSALAMRLEKGQTANLQSHLEGLRNDACGPLAVNVSVGQTEATDSWQALIDDDATTSRSKTLKNSTDDNCANAGRAWTRGAVTLARDDPDDSGHGYQRVETNLSAGLDARLAADLAVGFAIGGSNGSTIVSQGRTVGRAALGSVATYVSLHPSKSSFAEAAIGASRIGISDRVDGTTDALSGSADSSGYGAFATLSVGRVEHFGDLKLSPYLTAAGQTIRLGPTYERIDGADYHLSAQQTSSLSGTIGLKAQLPLRQLPDWIHLEPKAGVEFGYSLDRRADARLTALNGNASGMAEGSFSARRTLRLDIGTSVKLFDEVALDLDVESQPIAEGRPKTLRLSSSWDF
ncbi:autotransporter outer membrane beta-barrel domain-containing protein [Jiella sp. MQZ9-1]|uniref:Autotransporter outer membrane beta-barrel domain-containing protein n=1 Tax=Jiella flava TaxID=2816857 RepID=A0A939JVB2_9HYPH|nr:autotransporter outer membrane beta-barrel domain-containing protein [Jiella flava]MBO0664025.1 autotransporter outer membrane beta-barrel domain-containing protein [Jiella flava]MCD2472597.1 autotransporter outer membrane beta-barrel domain-containing protein [Jiella flava]